MFEYFNLSSIRPNHERIPTNSHPNNSAKTLIINEFEYLNETIEIDEFSDYLNLTIISNNIINYSYAYYWLFLVLIELFVFFGNVFLILLIILNKSLYNNNTTRIVLSLSITDLLLSLLVMPFTLYSQISYSNWGLGYGCCVLWLSSDIQLTTTSILHLCSISYERYLSVAKPIDFRNHIKQRIVYLISANWLVSLVLVTLTFAIISITSKYSIYIRNEYDLSYSCGFFSSVFIVYTTLITFWLPLVLMIFYGIKTMLLIKNLDRMHLNMYNFSKTEAANQENGVKKKLTTTRSNMSLYSLANGKDAKRITSSYSVTSFYQSQAPQVAEAKINPNTEEKRAENKNISSVFKNVPSINITSLSDDKANSSNNETEAVSSNNLTVSYGLRKMSNSKNISISYQENLNLAAISNTNRTSRQQVSTRKELQAQKTLTIVLVVFVLCYFPLFTYITFTSTIQMVRGELNKIKANHSSNLSYESIFDYDNYNYSNSSIFNDKSYEFYNLISSYNNNSSVGHRNKFQVKKYTSDVIFYFTTWLGYSSAAMNPLLHLFLNSNFKNALVTCLNSKKK